MGNNGGDGLAIARLLLDKNITSNIHYVCFSSKKFEDSSINLERLINLGVEINDISHREKLPCLNQNDIIIDAIFGSGLSRPIMGFTANLIEHINNSNALVISIDIPSGLNGNSGIVDPISVKADETITFGAPKLGMYFRKGPEFCGNVAIADIGFPP